MSNDDCLPREPFSALSRTRGERKEIFNFSTRRSERKTLSSFVKRTVIDTRINSIVKILELVTTRPEELFPVRRGDEGWPVSQLSSSRLFKETTQPAEPSQSSHEKEKVENCYQVKCVIWVRKRNPRRQKNSDFLSADVCAGKLAFLLPLTIALTAKWWDSLSISLPTLLFLSDNWYTISHHRHLACVCALLRFSPRRTGKKGPRKQFNIHNWISQAEEGNMEKSSNHIFPSFLVSPPH